MKQLKTFVLLLLMIATGTIGFVSCSKKETVSTATEKEYAVSLNAQEKT
jgi:hypothetical protein